MHLEAPTSSVILVLRVCICSTSTNLPYALCYQQVESDTADTLWFRPGELTCDRWAAYVVHIDVHSGSGTPLVCKPSTCTGALCSLLTFVCPQRVASARTRLHSDCHVVQFTVQLVTPATAARAPPSATGRVGAGFGARSSFGRYADLMLPPWSGYAGMDGHQRHCDCGNRKQCWQSAPSAADHPSPSTYHEWLNAMPNN